MSNNQNEIVPAKQRMASLRTLLMSEKVTKQIRDALPRHIDGTRMFRIYLTAMQNTPRILECDPISVVGAIIQAAQVGLSLDTVFGESYLIPRWNKNTGGHVATFQTGYKGLQKLALQSDKGIRDIYARVVHQNDVFEYSYEPKNLRHIPCDDPDSRGPLKYAYAKVIWKEDNYDRFVVVTAAEIKKAQAASDAYKKEYGPWIDNPEAMWAKTALRRLCNTLSLSPESNLSQALGAEDAENGGRRAIDVLDVDFSLPAPTQTSRDEDPLTKIAGEPADVKAPPKRRTPRRPEAEPEPAETQGQQQSAQQPLITDPRTGEPIT